MEQSQVGVYAQYLASDIGIDIATNKTIVGLTIRMTPNSFKLTNLILSLDDAVRMRNHLDEFLKEHEDFLE